MNPIYITVGNEKIAILPAPPFTVARVESSPVRVVFVADTVEELTSSETLEQAASFMLASVKRRGIRPKGLWCLGYLPADWPLWNDCVGPEAAASAGAKAAEINGHVMVYALFDTAEIEIIDLDSVGS